MSKKINIKIMNITKNLILISTIYRIAFKMKICKELKTNHFQTQIAREISKPIKAILKITIHLLINSHKVRIDKLN